MSITIPAQVFVEWAQWLDTGQAARVRADLADLLRDAANRGIIFAQSVPPDPPSSTPPNISTR